METIDELRAKAVASMSATTNPNSKLNQKKRGRPLEEEGELSSPDDEHTPTRRETIVRPKIVSENGKANKESGENDEFPSSSARQSTCPTTSAVEPNVATTSKQTRSSSIGRFFQLCDFLNSTIFSSASSMR
ncbi:hypothetical protein GIB67_022142 [Kingdonia uniflora]|uniref:Uncharacterized protein n=1 Tax=Kingdonia uniflora TaxID=39325 RepID=A0A7J7N8V1_9MAGN|nr:hypothetical protein GIB67_022142 [Kingdonia uniflora]